ncbi:Acetylxylan esterase [Hyphodiscus hymeniophilus]|uniref:Acetylxylan esterase n=1 Tax=Hyphodiscus hymeniophilus TaxID=353542 RepID=A0A9P7AZM3_9HELO|nr:Acetylxylan esterase [Hyphodiscus hymeniophilus]
MRYLSILPTIAIALTSFVTSHPAHPTTQQPIVLDVSHNSTNISIELFAELEELARIVDISYCVGTTGISKPFSCASRCDEFPAFELVDTFNTGPLMSDSCGYIVVDHGRERIGRAKSPRVIVAFRGTYSIANTIVDLSTVPQEYVPYPDSPDNSTSEKHNRGRRAADSRKSGSARSSDAGEGPDPKPTCRNCTVHTGFWTSWQNTRPLVVPHLEYLREKYPDYELHLVGHSLGGAVAALAGLEFDGLGWHPHVTTFGEPRVGNSGLRDWIDATFALPSEHDAEENTGRYRRVTHVDDPVPLLPLQEWGYRAHAGEVFISKAALQPTVADIRLCYGDEDVGCIAGAEVDEQWFNAVVGESGEAFSGQVKEVLDDSEEDVGKGDEVTMVKKRWGIPIPARYKIWQLFFAHRDYFWRLGLCVPGGDPLDWGRDKYHFGEGEGERQDEL